MIKVRPILTNYNAIFILQLIVTAWGLRAYFLKWLNSGEWLLWSVFFCISTMLAFFDILTQKNWRLDISAENINYQNLFGKQYFIKKDRICWKLIGSKFYDRFYIILSLDQKPKRIILQPHWENALILFTLKHSGKYSDTELYYLHRLGFKFDILGKVVVSRWNV